MVRLFRNQICNSIKIAGLVYAGLFVLIGCRSRIDRTTDSEQIPTTVNSSQPESSQFVTETPQPSFTAFVEAFPLKPDGGVWIDVPSYSSVPWFETRWLYRMTYDPAIWMLVEGDSIKEAPYRLVMKSNEACIITSTLPKEYGPGMMIKKEQIMISNVSFGRSGPIVDGIPVFVNYCSSMRTANTSTCYEIRGTMDSGTCDLESQKVIHTIQLIYNWFYQNANESRLKSTITMQ